MRRRDGDSQPPPPTEGSATPTVPVRCTQSMRRGPFDGEGDWELPGEADGEATAESEPKRSRHSSKMRAISGPRHLLKCLVVEPRDVLAPVAGPGRACEEHDRHRSPGAPTCAAARRDQGARRRARRCRGPAMRPHQPDLQRYPAAPPRKPGAGKPPRRHPSAPSRDPHRWCPRPPRCRPGRRPRGTAREALA